MAIDMFREVGELPARTVGLTIVAQDPSVLDAAGRIVRAEVRVPVDRRTEPGPRGHRLHVVDYDADRDVLARPAGEGEPRWTLRDRFAGAGDAALLADPAFLAQNVYAIAARTLATFESALGRRVPWGSGGHQLFLVPRAFPEANAGYADEDGAIYFGYLPAAGDGGAAGAAAAGPPATLYTCLSHDIVAHETTHAVLDGLLPRFDEPGLPDQAAFHEAFADIVALLSVFSIREAVAHALGHLDDRGRIPGERTSPERLKESVLFRLAEELGHAALGRSDGLRRSVALAPGATWRGDAEFVAPHRRGEVLVAAVLQTLVAMWSGRLAALVGDGGTADRERVAEEGAAAAGHLLRMVIRALDYCPPLEFEFEDFIDAVLTADGEIAPDDERGYRAALRQAFAAFDVRPPATRIIDLSQRPDRPLFHNLSWQALRTAPDEVFRFLWDNAAFFGIDTAYRLDVERVTPSTRVGADGFVVAESIATYVQHVDGTAGELRDLSAGALRVPPGLAGDTPLRLWGGGALVFDQFGGAKYHQTKPLPEWDRQSRRLEYLVGRRLCDAGGRYGFASATTRAERRRALHAPDLRAAERW
jgi:hypothetical protein